MGAKLGMDEEENVLMEMAIVEIKMPRRISKVRQ